MDTLVSITIYAVDEPPGWREHAASALDAMQHIEDLTSSYRDSSEIGKINLGAGAKRFSLSPEVYQLIHDAQQISQLTEGAFDMTVLPLLRLWDIKSPNPRVPTDEEILERRRLTGYEKIVVNDRDIFLPDSGMGLDLGGIAKGFAVDRAAEVLTKFGYKDFLVEAGGDLRAVAGELTRGQRIIWVRHPRQRDIFFAKIKLDEGAVSTSGDYERFFEMDGKRYHHIVDPQTGYPAHPNVSVTIVAEKSEMADGYSTAVFVLGPQRGMEFIENYPELAALIIYEEPAEGGAVLKWKASKNLADKITVIEN
jgi:thiamine biosynthesis lipoprotein